MVIIPRCGDVTRLLVPHQSKAGVTPENVVLVPGYYRRGYTTQYLLHCPPDDSLLFSEPPAVIGFFSWLSTKIAIENLGAELDQKQLNRGNILESGEQINISIDLKRSRNSM